MLFLDLDGTLLDDQNRQYQAYKQVLSMPDIRGHLLPQKGYLEKKRLGTTIPEIIKLAALMPTKHKIYQDRFREKIESAELLQLDTLHIGVKIFLEKMYRRTPISLISLRANRKNLEKQLDNLQIAKYFASILNRESTEEKHEKRAIAKAHLIKNYYKLFPKDSVYIGDTITDILAARQLGFSSFAIIWGHTSQERLMKYEPDQILPHISAALELLMPGGRWQL